MTTRDLFPSKTAGSGAGGANGETFVEGEVARVTFENTETGFRVVQLTVPGRAGRLTVVGAMPPLHPGAHVRVRGRMVTDARHGEQLRVESATELAPSTLKGIARYLGSGVVPGVGPKLAQRIVDTFGEATLRILDEEPEQLAKVAGLGRKRREEIIQTWRSERAARDVLVFLQAHGASPALANRIAKRYGANAAEIVRKDPYRLALDVPGVGFKTADRIAEGLGVAKDSPERMQAGLLQALLDENESGHVFSPARELRVRATELLGFGNGSSGDLDKRLVAALQRLWLGEHVVVERADTGDDRVYLPRMHAAEQRLAERVCELSGAKAKPLPGAEAAVAAFEREAHVTLADEQRTAVFEAARAPVFIVTGGPGVGKTTVLKAMLAVFRRSNVSVRLAAPTGRAAKRMTAATSVEAVTLHRLLEFDPQKGGGFKRDARNPIDAGAIIVDEASMIDLVLADALCQAVAPGTRLVFVGDVGQLPSIGPGAVLRDLIDSRAAPCVTLRRIFRQGEESRIVQNAHRIHEGLPPESAPPDAPNADFFIIERKDPERAAEAVTELVVSRIPRRFGLDPVRDIQVLTPMHRGAAGSQALNMALQAALNPHGDAVTRGDRVFRVGDKVMQLKNDYDRAIWNGDVGLVAAIDKKTGGLTVRFDDDVGPGRLVPYEPGALDNLTLAYACSVHKAQGSEYPAVVIPLLTSHFVMLSQKLLYTAVTRGKQLVVLVADPRAIAIALAEGSKDERHTRLADRIVNARTPLPL